MDSLKASSVKNSSSSFFCHHLLPLPSSLVFLSPSLLSFTVRKDYLWRDNSVPSCTRKDGGPQTLLQWVTLTAGDNCKDKIWVLVFFDAAALFQAACASAKCLWISGPRTWTYLSKISAVSLVCATRAFPPPAPGAFLFALCLYHVCDMGAWTMRAEEGSVALVMAYVFVPISRDLWGGVRWLPVEMSTSYGYCFFRVDHWKLINHFFILWFKEKILGMKVHARNAVSLCSFSQSPHGRLLLTETMCSLLCCEIKLSKVERKEMNVINEWLLWSP